MHLSPQDSQRSTARNRDSGPSWWRTPAEESRCAIYVEFSNEKLFSGQKKLSFQEQEIKATFAKLREGHGCVVQSGEVDAMVQVEVVVYCLRWMPW